MPVLPADSRRREPRASSPNRLTTLQFGPSMGGAAGLQGRPRRATSPREPPSGPTHTESECSPTCEHEVVSGYPGSSMRSVSRLDNPPRRGAPTEGPATRWDRPLKGAGERFRGHVQSRAARYSSPPPTPLRPQLLPQPRCQQVTGRCGVPIRPGEPPDALRFHDLPGEVLRGPLSVVKLGLRDGGKDRDAVPLRLPEAE